MQTIRNPAEWVAERLADASQGLGAVGRALRGAPSEAAHPPRIRSLTIADLTDAITRGLQDFSAARTDVLFLCIAYPLAGLAAVGVASKAALLPLLFPAVSGLALVGPAAAVGLYEMSRRREAGLSAGWADAFRVLSSPSFGAMLVLGLAIAGLFGLWMTAALAIHALTLGSEAPVSVVSFAAQVFGTPAGWAMVVIGCGVGFLFAALVLATSVVSFPLLLDRRVGVLRAVGTSMAVTRKNPVVIATWGLIVTVGLVLGSLPIFLGLIVVMPVLGHATWHLYRKAVEPA